jgi:alkanesulfonate monooxygenase SsuD/methylene tetrahydromethanopterin reductase-like flavin-dependent oxidoreductase (luciferase family)
MLDEAATLIRGLLTQPRTTFHGRHFRVENASCLPAPLQKRLPIWIGGVGERRTLRLAARHGDGWNAAYVTPKEFARLGKVLDGWCEKEGRDPATVSRGVNLTFNLATDAASVGRESERLKQDWGAAADRIAGGALLGTPRDAAARVLEYVDAGADAVNIALRAPWNEDALDAYIEDVMPAVRKAVGQRVRPGT